jgi:hypothetical protein
LTVVRLDAMMADWRERKKIDMMVALLEQKKGETSAEL